MWKLIERFWGLFLRKQANSMPVDIDAKLKRLQEIERMIEEVLPVLVKLIETAKALKGTKS